VSLIEILACHCSLSSTSFAVFRPILTVLDFWVIRLLTASLSLTFNHYTVTGTRVSSSEISTLYALEHRLLSAKIQTVCLHSRKCPSKFMNVAMCNILHLTADFCM
jgi:hypothetical protein